ncbi:hypothetical protein ACE3NQ_13490 [Paenibacillus terreus]|uniref:Uncharacterized protein n=1 Tax=Paenibacillus terreus TaxID=1387834 RepID=A0ABV5B8H6_9BACL
MKKPIHKKWWFWLIVILVIGVIANLNKNETVTTTQSSSQNVVEQNEFKETGNSTGVDVTSEPSTETKPRLAWVGIGTDLSSFEQAYGASSSDPDDIFISYSNEKYLCMVLDNKCTNLTINTDAGSIDETINEVKTMSPPDAKEVKRYELKDNSTDYLRTVVVYNSDTLSKSFDQTAFGDAEPGTFIAIFKSNQAQGVFAIVLGLGDNP